MRIINLTYTKPGPASKSKVVVSEEIPSGMKLGETAKYLIKKGCSNEHIVEIILSRFPNARTNVREIIRYRYIIKRGK